MYKTIVSLFILWFLLLTSCNMVTDMKGTFLFSNIPLYYQNYGDLNSPMDVSRYIRRHVSYKSDGPIDSAQTPQETLEKGAGDCEDFAILFMNIYYMTCGTKTDLVMVNTRHVVNGSSISHALVLLPDSILFEPETGNTYNYPIGYIYYFDDIFIGVRKYAK